MVNNTHREYAGFLFLVLHITLYIKIYFQEIKDSISTILSVARYAEENFNMYGILVSSFERENGVGQNIPQKVSCVFLFI